MNAKVNLTTPVGRLVMGSLYDPKTTNGDGEPLVTKNGANKGQPRVDYFFALAIPKNPGETHWAQTAWGAEIWKLGHQAFPQAAQARDFAWKIYDGDSREPGKLYKGKPGKPPCENEGWAGHWVLKFSGGFAPKVYQNDGSGLVQVMQKDFCKPGYFVQVAFSAEGNGSQTSPGIYLNHSMVCFRAYGAEIAFGTDVASAGFGAAPLPPGATMTPPASAMPLPQGSFVPPPALVAAVPTPLPQGGFAPTPVAPVATVPAPIPVIPNMGFVQVPPPAVAPAVPVPPAAPVRQMTAAAQGATYDQCIAQGWTDATLIQHGLMLA